MFPSRAEALPRAILEAMLTKVPIISTTVDGITELVQDNKSALLYSPGDIDSLASHIIQSLENHLNSMDLASSLHEILSAF